MKTNRSLQLHVQYITLVNKHVDELAKGKAEKSMEIEDFAGILCVHPVHLSNTVKAVSGKSACYFLQVRLLESACELLRPGTQTISDIAHTLDFEPSQFTKWFKRLTGITPKQFRQGKAVNTALLD